MTEPEEPVSRDITKNIDRDLIAAMSPEQRDAVVWLMSRAAEAAYRRGVQQGVTFAENRPATLRADLHDWRYGPSLDDAPWVDDRRIETSVSRLFTEHGDLTNLGLRVPMSEAIMLDFRMDHGFRSRGDGSH